MDDLQDTQIQNQPVNETAMDSLKTRYDKPSSNPFSGNTKMLTGFLAVAVLAVGLIAGIFIVSNSEQSLDQRGKASGVNVKVSLLDPVPAELTAGQTASLKVLLDNNNTNKLITAADITVEAGSENLTIQSIQITQDSELQQELLNDGSNGRYALGVTCNDTNGCDVFGDGVNDNAANSTQILTINVLANSPITADETVTISIVDAQVAALEAGSKAAINDNVGQIDQGVKTITLKAPVNNTPTATTAPGVTNPPTATAEPSPTNNPSGGEFTCQTVNFDGSDRIDIIDYSILAGAFNATKNDPNTGNRYEERFDFIDNSTGLPGSDSTVSILEFAYIANNFNLNDPCPTN